MITTKITKIGIQQIKINLQYLLAHGQWFSPATPASSTIKTGCHDIAEILLKVALNTKKQSYIHLLKMYANPCHIGDRLV
jgi:hypothetical protein